MTLTDLIFSEINAPLTILLIVLAAYRLVTLLFGLDLDFDMDIDIDVDVDVDTDFDIDGGPGFDSTGLDLEDVSNLEVKKEAVVGKRPKPLKWWQILLLYFNFVELPFLFTFTSWTFFWWMFTVLGTYYTNSYNTVFGLTFFFGAIIPSLLVNKIFTTPFKAFFKKLERKGVESLDLIGRRGTLLSNLQGDKLGSIKLFVESDPINVYAKALNGEKIASGTEILIIKESTDKKYYYIQSYQ